MLARDFLTVETIFLQRIYVWRAEIWFCLQISSIRRCDRSFGTRGV